MNRYFIGADAQGKIVLGCSITEFQSAEGLHDFYAAQGLRVDEVPEPDYDVLKAAVATESHYRDSNAGFVERAAQPSDYHAWDWASCAWVAISGAFESAKVERCTAVNRLRDAKRNLPVLYEGKLFDADAGSVESMRETSDRIRRGDGLPSGWAGWRTYDNSMVWASETDAAVLEHLTAIRRMLEDRWQALLISAWGHKDVIAGLSDVGAVMNYDFSGGWPT